MCTRYTLAASEKEIKDYFNVEIPTKHEPLYNAAPADILPVITHNDSQGLSYFYWGIPPEWARKKDVSVKLINAPAEQLLSRASFKIALQQRRCIIPADGFYVWKKVGKKTKIPHRFINQDKSLMAFAGIWDEFEAEDPDKKYHTFMIITTEANKNVAEVDEKMPCILNKEEVIEWMSEESNMEELIKLVKPYAEDKLHGYTVSNRIDFPGENSPNLIKHSKPVDQHGNYSLFG